MPTTLICLAGHGEIAAGVASAATLVFGPSDMLRTAPAYSGDIDELRATIDGLLEEVGPDGSLVMVSDLLGGSVSNTILTYQNDTRVRHFTGMNLALVLELLMNEPTGADGFPPAFVEEIRAMITPLPLPVDPEADQTSPNPADEEDF